MISPSNTLTEMLLKRRDYFTWGIRLVWEIDPDRQMARVYTAAEQPDATLDATGTLDGGIAVPGFTLPLAELFTWVMD